jgi:hypothetical protein
MSWANDTDGARMAHRDISSTSSADLDLAQACAGTFRRIGAGI